MPTTITDPLRDQVDVLTQRYQDALADGLLSEREKDDIEEQIDKIDDLMGKKKRSDRQNFWRLVVGLAAAYLIKAILDHNQE